MRKHENSSKVILGIKEFQGKFEERCIEYERYFQFYFLSVFALQPNNKPDTSILRSIYRHYPVDVIAKANSSSNSKAHDEQILNSILHNLFIENGLLDIGNSEKLLSLISNINSSFYVFKEISEQYPDIEFQTIFSYYDNLIKDNNELHQRIAEIAIDQQSVNPTYPDPHKLPTGLIRKDDIIEQEQTLTINSRTRAFSHSIPIQNGLNLELESAEIRSKIKQLVNKNLRNPGDCDKHLKLERSEILTKAKKLDSQPDVDISTLSASLYNAESQFTLLTEQKNSLLTEINQFKHLRSKGIQKNDEYEISTNENKVSNFESMIIKNRIQLQKIQAENIKLEKLLEQHQYKKRMNQLSE